MYRLLVAAGVLLACSLGVAAAQQPAGAPVPGAPVPLEQLTRYDEFGAIKLSPDGEFVAATAGKYGPTRLVFMNLKDRTLVIGTEAPPDSEILNFEWVSATRVIYFTAERQLGRVRTTPADIFAIDRDGRRRAKIYYGYRAGEDLFGTRVGVPPSNYATPELISTLEHDDQFVLIAVYPWIERTHRYYFDPDAKPLIVRLDVYTGRWSLRGSAPLRGAEVLVDMQDQVRFAVGYNADSKLAALWKPQPDSDWQSFDLPGFRAETVRPRSLTADNKAALVSGVREGESRSALYRVDLQSQAVEKLYQHPEADVDELVTDLNDESAVGVRVYAGKPELHWLNAAAPMATLYKMLQRAFPGQVVEVGSKTRDGRLLLVLVSSDVNPGEYYLFDTQKKQAEFFLAAKSWIDPRAMRPKEIVTIKARDGLTLQGYLTRPAATGPQPLIVLPHGGPHGVRDDWAFDWEVQLLASRGYAVLQVNFRGSGGYGVDFESAGYRQWGAKMQDDLTDATRWAVTNGVTQSDRICIYGAGYGGYAALMGAVREPKLYRCAIGHVGVYDLELLFTSGDVSDSKSGRNHLDKVLGDNPADLRERSPVHNAGRIEVPILLVHGKEAAGASYQHAKRMKAALEANQRPLEWLGLSGEGHGGYDAETRRELYEKLLTFLARNLRTAPSAAVRPVEAERAEGSLR